MTTHTITTNPPAVGTRTALRWIPTFLGYPLGGLAAELVTGRVDGPIAALLGGAITGAVLGTTQWLGLRRAGIPPRWIGATALGLACGLGAGAAWVGYRTSLGALAAQGAVSGAVVGAAQALILRRHLGRLATGWPALLAAVWASGWTITTAVGVDVDAQYTVFGSTGALAATVATAILPLALARAGRRGAGVSHRMGLM